MTLYHISSFCLLLLVNVVALFQPARQTYGTSGDSLYSNSNNHDQLVFNQRRVSTPTVLPLYQSPHLSSSILCHYLYSSKERFEKKLVKNGYLFCLYTVNRLLFAATLFCDLLEINWLATTNFCDQAFSRSML